MASLSRIVAGRGAMLRDYSAAISGSVGRLVFSLAYFVALANALSISDFGLFATASGAGVVLSRILAFGFITSLYRAATVKPQLVGAYSAGFLLMAALSLPVIALAVAGTHALIFAGEISLAVFALIMISETFLWRVAEAIIIVNNGMGRFGRAAILVIIGTAARALAALAFSLGPHGELSAWAWYYLAANAVTLAVALAFFQPRQRLRFKLAIYWRRLADSAYVAGAEILFYLQMEMDRILILALGGARLAGIYAIVMRLADLTAVPIRTFTMMLVQSLMRTPAMLERVGMRAGIEIGIFAVSTAGMLTLGLILHWWPTLLGSNVAQAAPLVLLALLVPAFRNLVEYHAELLFARGQTLVRAANLAMLGLAKALFLYHVIAGSAEPADLVWSLQYAFAAVYGISLALTYSAMRMPARQF